MTVSDDDYFQKTGKQKIIILQASSENLKRLDDAITDYNIVIRAMIRARPAILAFFF